MSPKRNYTTDNRNSTTDNTGPTQQELGFLITSALDLNAEHVVEAIMNLNYLEPEQLQEIASYINAATAQTKDSTLTQLLKYY